MTLFRKNRLDKVIMNKKTTALKDLRNLTIKEPGLVNEETLELRNRSATRAKGQPLTVYTICVYILYAV